MKLLVRDYCKLQNIHEFKKGIVLYELDFGTIENVDIKLIVDENGYIHIYISNDNNWNKLKTYNHFNFETEEYERFYSEDKVDSLCHVDIYLPNEIIESLFKMIDDGTLEIIN